MYMYLWATFFLAYSYCLVVVVIYFHTVKVIGIHCAVDNNTALLKDVV